jgi:hypothetical protein
VKLGRKLLRISRKLELGRTLDKVKDSLAKKTLKSKSTREDRNLKSKIMALIIMARIKIRQDRM